MKAKIIIFFLLLVILGGTVFYFGWIQIRLNEHSYGVIFTKTSGYEQEVVRPGEFNWRWEAIIPTNMTLHRIDVSPRSMEIGKQGKLPSGEIYGSILKENPDFSYSFNLRVEYKLLPEKLPTLVEEQGINDESMDQFYTSFEQNLSNRVARFIESRIDSSDPAIFPTSTFTEALKKDLRGIREEIEIVQVSLLKIEIPDMRLYRNSRDYYMDILDTRRETEAATLRKEREWVVSEEAKLQVLKQYGELFTEYPGLVQYLALSQGKDMEKVVPPIDLLKQKTDKTVDSAETEVQGENSVE